VTELADFTVPTVLINLLDPEPDPDPNLNPNQERKFRIRIRIQQKRLGSSRIRIRIRNTDITPLKVLPVPRMPRTVLFHVEWSPGLFLFPSAL
jgi:hypothetical protein